MGALCFWKWEDALQIQGMKPCTLQMERGYLPSIAAQRQSYIEFVNPASWRNILISSLIMWRVVLRAPYAFNIPTVMKAPDPEDGLLVHIRCLLSNTFRDHEYSELRILLHRFESFVGYPRVQTRVRWSSIPSICSYAIWQTKGNPKTLL